VAPIVHVDAGKVLKLLATYPEPLADGKLLGDPAIPQVYALDGFVVKPVDVGPNWVAKLAPPIIDTS
jgi:hypothetical protein